MLPDEVTEFEKDGHQWNLRSLHHQADGASTNYVGGSVGALSTSTVIVVCTVVGIVIAVVGIVAAVVVRRCRRGPPNSIDERAPQCAIQESMDGSKTSKRSKRLGHGGTVSTHSDRTQRRQEQFLLAHTDETEEDREKKKLDEFVKEKKKKDDFAKSLAAILERKQGPPGSDLGSSVGTGPSTIHGEKSVSWRHSLLSKSKSTTDGTKSKSRRPWSDVGYSVGRGPLTVHGEKSVSSQDLHSLSRSKTKSRADVTKGKSGRPR